MIPLTLMIFPSEEKSPGEGGLGERKTPQGKLGVKVKLLEELQGVSSVWKYFKTKYLLNLKMCCFFSKKVSALEIVRRNGLA